MPFFSPGGNKNQGSVRRTHSHYCWIQKPRGFLGPQLCCKVLWITFIEVVVFRFLHPEAHSKLAYSFVARLCLYVCFRRCGISAAVHLPINIYAFLFYFFALSWNVWKQFPWTVIIVSRAAVAHVKERRRGFRTTVHSLSLWAPEQRLCLLLPGSQWTKPQSVYQRLFERSTLSQRCHSYCSAATAAARRQMFIKHKQSTLSEITLIAVLPNFCI